MTSRSIVLALAALLTPVALAHAQYPYYGGPYYGGGYGGGTVQGSYAHGFADVVRSAGWYNLLTSEAAINNQDAYSKYLDNRLKQTQTYFEMRKMNRAYREAEHRRLFPKKTMEDYARYARERAPSRLKSTQLDPVTGFIAWPRAFREEKYEDIRADLEKLFAERSAANGAIGNKTYYKIQQLSDQMLNMLKDDVAEVPAVDYTKARKFIISLGYESRFPAS